MNKQAVTGGEMCKITLWIKPGDHPEVKRLTKDWSAYGEPCTFCGITLSGRTHGEYRPPGRLICPNTWFIDFMDGSGVIRRGDISEFSFLWRDFQDKINETISKHIGQRKLDGASCPNCSAAMSMWTLEQTGNADYRLANKTCESCGRRWTEYFKLVGYSLWREPATEKDKP